MSPDYDIIIKRLHLHYDMKLGTLELTERNLIIQFQVFVQPYMQ